MTLWVGTPHNLPSWNWSTAGQGVGSVHICFLCHTKKRRCKLTVFYFFLSSESLSTERENLLRASTETPNPSRSVSFYNMNNWLIYPKALKKRDPQVMTARLSLGFSYASNVSTRQERVGGTVRKKFEFGEGQFSIHVIAAIEWMSEIQRSLEGCV